jgi:hypothetical protein
MEKGKGRSGCVPRDFLQYVFVKQQPSMTNPYIFNEFGG